MTQFYSDTVKVVSPPLDFESDNPAIVDGQKGRMVLERGDLTWASWVMLCRTPVGHAVNILVRQ